MFRLYFSGVCTVQLLKSCHLELHKQYLSLDTVDICGSLIAS